MEFLTPKSKFTMMKRWCSHTSQNMFFFNCRSLPNGTMIVTGSFSFQVECLKQYQEGLLYQYAVKTPVTKTMKPEYSAEEQWRMVDETDLFGMDKVCRVLKVPVDQLVTHGTRFFVMTNFIAVILS